MEYYIFTDEAGSWNHKGEYYLRSWVCIEKQVYQELCEVLKSCKQKKGIKILKWKKFIKNNEDFINIKELKCKIFITITNPSIFLRKQYPQLAQLASVDYSLNSSSGNTSWTDNFVDDRRKKVVEALRNEIFLDVYERRHILNALYCFKTLLAGDLKDFYLEVNKPQFYAKHWADRAKIEGVGDVKFYKNEEEIPGLELADIIVSGFKSILQNLNHQELQIFKEFFAHKMTDMFVRDMNMCNPNIIYFNDEDPNLKERIRIIRNFLIS